MTWWVRFVQAWRQTFYRNSMIYCMVLLTLLVVLQITEPVTGIRCGL